MTDQLGTDHDDAVDPAPSSGRAGRVAAWVVAVTAYVYVLFTWVFPWLTEMGFSPTMDG